MYQMLITQHLKQLLGIYLILLLAASLTACDNPAPANAPQTAARTEFAKETVDPEVSIRASEETAKATVTSVSKNSSFEIPSLPSNEKDFIDDLDISVLERIASEIQSLVAEIGEKEKADPDFVLQGKWNEYFRSSEQYNVVLDLGLKAVKPAYYIIYKSPLSGLYEYILASAIDEITGYDYAVTESYGWSTSKQFLEMYNEKVLKTLASFKEILENQSLSQEEKVKQIRSLGIFAVAPLLNEIDNPSSDLSGESLESCLWGIIEDYSIESVDHNLENWRSENEQTYQNIIEILE